MITQVLNGTREPGQEATVNNGIYFENNKTKKSNPIPSNDGILLYSQ